MANLKQAELNFINSQAGTTLTLTQANDVLVLINARDEVRRHVQSVYQNMLSVEDVFNAFQPGGALHIAAQNAAWTWFDDYGALFDLAQPEFERPA